LVGDQLWIVRGLNGTDKVVLEKLEPPVTGVSGPG